MPPVPLPRVLIGILKAANNFGTTVRRVQNWRSSFILVNPRKWFFNTRKFFKRSMPRPRKFKRIHRRYLKFRKKKRQKRRTLFRGRNQAKKRPRLSWRVQTMLIRDPELRQFLFDRFTTQRTLMASQFSGQPEAYATSPEFHPLVSGNMQVLSKRLFQYAARGPVSFFMPVAAPPPQSKADPFHELYQLKLQMGLVKPLDEPQKTVVETERDKEKALIEKITKQIPLKGSTRLMKSLGSVYLGIDWESKMTHGHYLFKQDTLSNFSYMRLAKYNRIFEGFSHAEAYTYLNIKEPMMHKLDPLWLLLKAKHLFLINNPAKGGSKYLQAKVIYALLYLMHWNAQIDSSVDFTDPLTKWTNEELAKNNPEKRLAALADMTSDYKEASRQLDAGEIKLEDYNDFIFAPPPIRTHPLWEQVDKTFSDLAAEIRDIEPELHEIQREIERRRPDLQKEREKWTYSGAVKSRSKKKYRPRMRKVGPRPTPVAGKEPQKPTLPKPSGALLTYVMDGVTEIPREKVYGTGRTYELEIQQAREEESKRGKGRK